MKNSFTIILVFLLFYHCSGQKVESSFSFGVPINQQMDWDSPNYSLDFMLGEKINTNSVLGIGANYENINLIPSKNELTYDRNALTLFGAYRHSFFISDKVKLLPQVRIGYSFLKSELNEFDDVANHSNGIYISERIDFSYILNRHLSIIAGGAYSSVFSELKPSSNISIPSGYIIGSNKKINHFNVMLGCTYNFGD
jgi:hypothetical protein